MQNLYGIVKYVGVKSLVECLLTQRGYSFPPTACISRLRKTVWIWGSILENFSPKEKYTFVKTVCQYFCRQQLAIVKCPSVACPTVQTLTICVNGHMSQPLVNVRIRYFTQEDAKKAWLPRPFGQLSGLLSIVI